jgi:glycosidase
MPDLNITDPDEMHKVLGFWLEPGVSGFRVDSLPFMIETIGTSAKDQPVTYLRSLVEFLERRRGDPAQAQFANFCRHHDELNLGLLSDSEREEVFAAFAPEPEHRVYGRGIRRRLAPMLGHDQERIRRLLYRRQAVPAGPRRGAVRLSHGQRGRPAP